MDVRVGDRRTSDWSETRGRESFDDAERRLHENLREEQVGNEKARRERLIENVNERKRKEDDGVEGMIENGEREDGEVEGLDPADEGAVDEQMDERKMRRRLKMEER